MTQAPARAPLIGESPRPRPPASLRSERKRRAGVRLRGSRPRWNRPSGCADPSGLQAGVGLPGALPCGEREAGAAHPQRPHPPGALGTREPAGGRGPRGRGLACVPGKRKGRRAPCASQPGLGTLRTAGTHAATTSKAWRVLRAPGAALAGLRPPTRARDASCTLRPRQGGPASTVSVRSGRKNGSPDKSGPTRGSPGPLLCAGLWPRRAGAQQETGWAGRAPADRGRARVQADWSPSTFWKLLPGH